MYAPLLSTAYSLHPVGRHLKELARTQWLTGEEIQAIQFKKLRAMLEHCYRTVPHYHRVMKEAGIRPKDVRSLEDLCRVPPIGKSEIRKDPALFRSRDMTRDVMEETTSGSTGEPFRFLRSKGTYQWELAASRRQYEWTGYRLGDRWANIRRVRGFGSPRTQLEEATRDVLLRRLRVDHIKISREGMRRGVERIVSFKPFLVRAFAKSLLEFGRFAQEENASIPVVVSTGETISPYERRLMADSWGGEVYDMYGGAEARSVASECSEHRGLHVTDELYLLEFVKDGEHVSPGEQGRILVTSLCHWVQPFIRYDAGDISAPLDEECPCGRGLSLMSTVEGRYLDVIETEDGRLVFASAFTRWFMDLKIRQFQIEQLGKTKTILRIVPAEGYTGGSGETLATRARAFLGTNVDVDVHVTDVIPDYRSDKRQIVKSRVHFPATARQG